MPNGRHPGPAASAALPELWKALAKGHVSRAELAEAIGVSRVQVTRILNGDRKPGRRTDRFIAELFPRVRVELWDKPCPEQWRLPDPGLAKRTEPLRRAG